jgi:hypothetical protein
MGRDSVCREKPRAHSPRPRPQARSIRSHGSRSHDRRRVLTPPNVDMMASNASSAIIRRWGHKPRRTRARALHSRCQFPVPPCKGRRACHSCSQLVLAAARRCW